MTAPASFRPSVRRMMRLRPAGRIFRRFTLLVVALVSAHAPSARALDYEKDVMPVLMAKCADCHSTKAEKVKGGLKFDDPKHFQSRFPKNDVVIPGNWDESYLFVTLFRPSDAKEVMPPKGKGERLNLDELRLVMQWITEGAPINGDKGKTGTMPENIEDLLLDLPPDTAAKLREELAVKAEAGEPAGDASAAPAMRTWTNRQGRAIRAELVRVEGAIAVLKTEDGKEYRYPIADLSDESRARLGKAVPQ